MLEILLQQCLSSSCLGNRTPDKTSSAATTLDSSESPSRSSEPSTQTQPVTFDQPSPIYTLPDVDADPDPLSDNTDFLSFEQWKAQMLQKGGQSPEHVRGTRDGTQKPDSRQRPGSLNTALDTLGDDVEIELELGGFTREDGAARPTKQQEGQGEDPATAVPEVEQKPKHTKIAGTTSTERFNYASFDCAATVLKTNGECKGPSSVLVENKDTYMLNVCTSKNKFLIVELCNDILIDTIVLGNFEFFSSTFRTFRVSISDRYPVKLDKWKELGNFEAQNTRGIQAFMIENGLIWARYLRIEFLSHYGSEYYCPVSLLRVHGKTMMDDYLNEVKASRGEDDGDDEDESVENVEEPMGQAIREPSDTAETTPQPDAPSPLNASRNARIIDVQNICLGFCFASPLIESSQLFCYSCNANSTLSSTENPEDSQTQPPDQLLPKNVNSDKTTTSSSVSPDSLRVMTLSSTTIESKTSAVTSDHILAPKTTVPLSNEGSSKTPFSLGDTKTATPSASASMSKSTTESAPSIRARHPSSSSSTSTNATAAGSHRTAPAAPAPTTQDSFFKSVHKRLLQLESNSTLSLQYIEEQSRLLRDALTRAEHRQRARASAFAERVLRSLGAELRTELQTDLHDSLHVRVDHATQEIATVRDAGRRELGVLAATIHGELRFLRRLAALQAVALVALCVGLVAFARRRSSRHSTAAARIDSGANGVPKAPVSRRAAHFRDDSGDISDRPSTPSPRRASRPNTRYGRLMPLRSTALDGSRPLSRGSAFVPDAREGRGVRDERGQLTPTPSDTEGERERPRGLSPGWAGGLRRTWSTPALGQMEGALGPEEERGMLDGGEL